jgi:hypothetical protein
MERGQYLFLRALQDYYAWMAGPVARLNRMLGHAPFDQKTIPDPANQDWSGDSFRSYSPRAGGIIPIFLGASARSIRLGEWQLGGCCGRYPTGSVRRRRNDHFQPPSKLWGTVYGVPRCSIESFQQTGFRSSNIDVGVIFNRSAASFVRADQRTIGPPHSLVFMGSSFSPRLRSWPAASCGFLP